MNRNAFRKKAERIYDEARETLYRKNADYAPNQDALANFRHGGFRSIAYRVAEKAVRLRNLLNNSSTNCESARDSLLDLLNYSVIGILMLDQKKRRTSPRKRS